MADVTITGLPGGTTPSGSELIVLDQGGSTVRLSLSDIFLQGGEETLTSFSYDNNTNVFSYIAEDGNSSDINFGDEFLTQEIGTDWNTGTPQGNDKLYIKNIGAHTDYDPIGSGSDVDSNNNYFLDKDEFSLVISDNDNSTDGPNSHGIVLYNSSGTAGSFAPSILFASKETGSTDFRAATAGIYCRSPLGVGGVVGATSESDTNYGDGELIFATSGLLNDTTINSKGLTQRMVIDRSGKVGIGVSNPAEALDVSGNISSSGNISASGDVSAGGDVIVIGTVTTSTPTNNGHATTKLYVDNAITASNSVAATLLDESVTLPKLAPQTDQTIIGNISGASASPVEVPIVGGILINNDSLGTDDTKGATQGSVKAYVDSEIATVSSTIPTVNDYKPNIVQVVKTNSQVITTNPNNQWFDIPGLTASIIPKYSNSKMYVQASVSAAVNNASYSVIFKLLREVQSDSSPEGFRDIHGSLGDLDNLNRQATFAVGYYGGYAMQTGGINYLDNPSVLDSPKVVWVTTNTSTGDVFDTAYYYDEINQYWYNGRDLVNGVPTPNNSGGYFLWSQANNRWQFGATLSYAQAGSAYLSPSPTEAEGFWSIDANQNWLGNASIRARCRRFLYSTNQTDETMTVGVPISYKIQCTCETTVDIYINRSNTKASANHSPVGISTLTIQEMYQ